MTAFASNKLAVRYFSPGGFQMSGETRIQLNVRISKDTSNKLDEIVEYYQENTKLGRIYKGDVLTDIIEKSYEVMNKQKRLNKKF